MAAAVATTASTATADRKRHLPCSRAIADSGSSSDGCKKVKNVFVFLERGSSGQWAAAGGSGDGWQPTAVVVATAEAHLLGRQARLSSSRLITTATTM